MVIHARTNGGLSGSGAFPGSKCQPEDRVSLQRSKARHQRHGCCRAAAGVELPSCRRVKHKAQPQGARYERYGALTNTRFHRWTWTTSPQAPAGLLLTCASSCERQSAMRSRVDCFRCHTPTTLQACCSSLLCRPFVGTAPATEVHVGNFLKRVQDGRSGHPGSPSVYWTLSGFKCRTNTALAFERQRRWRLVTVVPLFQSESMQAPQMGFVHQFERHDIQLSLLAEVAYRA